VLCDEARLDVRQVIFVDAHAHLHRDRHSGRAGRLDRSRHDATEEPPPPWQRGAAALAGHLGDRAAEVHVNVVGEILLNDHPDRRRDHGWVHPVQLDTARSLNGLEGQHPHRLGVALHQSPRGHHLADVQPTVGASGSLALLTAEPPEGDVGDPRHRGEDNGRANQVRPDRERRGHVPEHGTGSARVGNPMWRALVGTVTLATNKPERRERLMKPWRGEAVARTAAAVAVAAALSLAACSSNGAPPAGGNSALGEAPAGMGGSGDPGAPPSPAPTPEPISTVVQAKGFLQAPDAGNGGSAEILPSSRVSEARINPCGGALPSDKQRVARAAAFVVYRFNDIPDSTPDGTAYEVISRYSGDGASAYLKDLRDAVSRCPSRTEGEISYTFAIADSGFAGDESVLVKEPGT